MMKNNVQIKHEGNSEELEKGYYPQSAEMVEKK